MQIPFLFAFFNFPLFSVLLTSAATNGNGSPKHFRGQIEPAAHYQVSIRALDQTAQYAAVSDGKGAFEIAIAEEDEAFWRAHSFQVTIGHTAHFEKQPPPLPSSFLYSMAPRRKRGLRGSVSFDRTRVVHRTLRTRIAPTKSYAFHFGSMKPLIEDGVGTFWLKAYLLDSPPSFRHGGQNEGSAQRIRVNIKQSFCKLAHSAGDTIEVPTEHIHIANDEKAFHEEKVWIDEPLLRVNLRQVVNGITCLRGGRRISGTEIADEELNDVHEVEVRLLPFSLDSEHELSTSEQVWNYFGRTPDGQLRCKGCGCEQSAGDPRKYLARHLRESHPAQLGELKRSLEVVYRLRYPVLCGGLDQNQWRAYNFYYELSFKDQKEFLRPTKVGDTVPKRRAQALVELTEEQWKEEDLQEEKQKMVDSLKEAWTELRGANGSEEQIAKGDQESDDPFAQIVPKLDADQLQMLFDDSVERQATSAKVIFWKRHPIVGKIARVLCKAIRLVGYVFPFVSRLTPFCTDIVAMYEHTQLSREERTKSGKPKLLVADTIGAGLNAVARILAKMGEELNRAMEKAKRSDKSKWMPKLLAKLLKMLQWVGEKGKQFEHLVREKGTEAVQKMKGLNWDALKEKGRKLKSAEMWYRLVGSLVGIFAKKQQKEEEEAEEEGEKAAEDGRGDQGRENVCVSEAGGQRQKSGAPKPTQNETSPNLEDVFEHAWSGVGRKKRDAQRNCPNVQRMHELCEQSDSEIRRKSVHDLSEFRDDALEEMRKVIRRHQPTNAFRKLVKFFKQPPAVAKWLLFWTNTITLVSGVITYFCVAQNKETFPGVTVQGEWVDNGEWDHSLQSTDWLFSIFKRNTWKPNWEFVQNVHTETFTAVHASTFGAHLIVPLLVATVGLYLFMFIYFQALAHDVAVMTATGAFVGAIGAGFIGLIALCGFEYPSNLGWRSG